MAVRQRGAGFEWPWIGHSEQGFLVVVLGSFAAHIYGVKYSGTETATI